jgi:methyltransferase (TIGR00027 family)
MPHADTPIRDVSDTAFMVAMWRAQESRRPDALIRDPLAERIAGEEGRRIIAGLPKNLFFGGWTVVIRTVIIDRFITEAIASGVDTIVNLGAGLDSRPYRMDLPANLRWIEADYPALIELKESRLSGEKPRCQLERVKIDLADGERRRAFLHEVVARSDKVLVLTEGVTPYLEIGAVAALADDLRREPKVRVWIVDYFSPQTYQYRARAPMKRAMQNAPFRFQPEDYFGFFASHGWKPAEVRYLTDEGRALNRPFPLPLWRRWLFGLMLRFSPLEKRRALARFAGFVRFEPAE